MGDFSGIDPQAMIGMIKHFTTEKDDLRAHLSSLKDEFAGYGLDTGPFNELLGICGWLDDQLPMLQRRQGLAAAMDLDPSTVHMVQLPEPMTQTAAEAHAAGKALADQFVKNSTGDGNAA